MKQNLKTRILAFFASSDGIVFENIITKNQGKIIKTENWGLKNLSHKIKSNKKGFYFHIKFEGVGKTVEELEKEENIDETLFRFLTIKVKKHQLETNSIEKTSKK